MQLLIYMARIGRDDTVVMRGETRKVESKTARRGEP
ncbi:hypothetical protein A2U01_0083901, partial [Trifolium medium]|nr:hypothetical protein [Trifolium medium]